ncbi:unnamed protein product [Ilex paraguariensis]|uniref:Uncharacterized protein n=1 Tax=Ilex paraguariensis TaxID=185542 RepID=A0ABC8S8F1_9AQUA
MAGSHAVRKGETTIRGGSTLEGTPSKTRASLDDPLGEVLGTSHGEASEVGRHRVEAGQVTYVGIAGEAVQAGAKGEASWTPNAATLLIVRVELI